MSVSRYITNKQNTIQQHGDGSVIAGSNGRASCLILAYSGDVPITVAEDDLEGRSYIANGYKKVVYADEFKRLSARTEALHPRLVSIAFPFRDASTLPSIEVSYHSPSDTHTCQLTFPDGRVDLIRFDPTDARLLRTNP